MKSLNTVLALAAIAGFALVAQPDVAAARCVGCDVPIAKTNVRTVTHTRRVEQVRTITRVQNVNRDRYVRNVTRIVTRTLVVPVTRVNTITRVHNRTYNIDTTRNVSGGTIQTAGRTVPGWSRTETVNHRPVAVRQCGCG